MKGKCPSIFFPMLCDIYYASEEQDQFGKIEKKWYFDRSEQCTFYSLGDRSNNNNFVYDLSQSQFFKLETMLFGRSKSDIRKESNGLLRPLSHLLITNIRSGGKCESDESFYIETNGLWVGRPTVFEVKTIQPLVGPFKRVEYYKIQLERSDSQELNQI